MKVLVTGGAGFIGSHITDRLARSGPELVVLDDLSTGHIENLNPPARFYQMDVGSPWLDELFRIEKPEAVVHQAAQASVRRSVDDPVFDGRVNVLGTIALLQASVRNGVRRFLFASTGGALYGDADVTPTPEDYPTLPVSPYGASKLASEVYLRTFNALHGLSYAALRYANVYGPRQDPHGEAGVVAIFSRRLLAGEATRINGDGRQTRDFVFVKDVAEANALALESTEVGSFNVGTGKETDVNTIFSILKRLAGSDQPEQHGPPLQGEQKRSVVDAKKLKEKLGWAPLTDLETGLTATVDYFRAQVPARQAPAPPR
ncbi:MAG TPA: NAD-dependent epimerase/dehydratase family protein [Candidatus Dormibacteraeota bacterium]|nr:NAD-dependent epimerase/dehydratase family protein [Candidatus Dormibacteraeota bacterium]